MLTIVGRSSSHFTRVTRIYAAELGVAVGFEVVHDLMSVDPQHYGGHPALKLPTLRTERGTLFGALNICRELWRSSGCNAGFVWPEDLAQPLLANAQELVLHAMATEVLLVMGKAGGGGTDGYAAKMSRSLVNTIAWLEQNVDDVLAGLPPGRAQSYLETTLYCLVTHLEFRQVLATAPYRALTAFCDGFGERPSARATPYRFDR